MVEVDYSINAHINFEFHKITREINIVDQIFVKLLIYLVIIIAIGFFI